MVDSAQSSLGPHIWSANCLITPNDITNPLQVTDDISQASNSSVGLFHVPEENYQHILRESQNLEFKLGHYLMSFTDQKGGYLCFRDKLPQPRHSSSKPNNIIPVNFKLLPERNINYEVYTKPFVMKPETATKIKEILGREVSVHFLH